MGFALNNLAALSDVIVNFCIGTDESTKIVAKRFRGFASLSVNFTSKSSDLTNLSWSFFLLGTKRFQHELMGIWLFQKFYQEF
jgi:hypothetical protein